MIKDERYLTVKRKLDSGDIKEFDDIFKELPKTTFRDDLRTNSSRINLLIEEPQRFKVYELYFLGVLTGVDVKVIIDLAIKKFREELAEKGITSIREYIYNNLLR
jgi:hypothetical protein